MFLFIYIYIYVYLYIYIYIHTTYKILFYWVKWHQMGQSLEHAVSTLAQGPIPGEGLAFASHLPPILEASFIDGLR